MMFSRILNQFVSFLHNPTSNPFQPIFGKRVLWPLNASSGYRRVQGACRVQALLTPCLAPCPYMACTLSIYGVHPVLNMESYCGLMQKGEFPNKAKQPNSQTAKQYVKQHGSMCSLPTWKKKCTKLYSCMTKRWSSCPLLTLGLKTCMRLCDWRTRFHWLWDKNCTLNFVIETRYPCPPLALT